MGIVRRQRNVAQGIHENPLAVFPEEGITNSEYLHSFDNTAFRTELPITPAYFNVTYCGVMNPTKVNLPLLHYFIMICSSFTLCHAKIHYLPVFTPNDYFFKKHDAKKGLFNFMRKGTPRSEIYCWAIRNIIAKAAGLKLYDR